MTDLAATTRVSPRPSDYHFDHPRLFPDVLNDLFVREGDLGPGDRVGPFELPGAGGALVSVPDPDGRPVLLVFGSRTCPATASSVAGLKELHGRHGDRVRFVMVQVREAHPGATISQPHTAERKLRNATALVADHQLPFEVAVDDLEGTVHRRFAARPNSAFIIDAGGTIVFRAQWAVETEAIAEALGAVVAGEAPRRPDVRRTFHALTRAIGYAGPSLDAAGTGARLDTWKVMPPLGLMMMAADAFFFLPRRHRGAAGLVALTFLAATAVVALLL